MTSSRIFVQGIPPNISAGELKKHFSKQGVVTDAKTLGDRRIGYIGYKTAEEAAKALKYFHKSYLRMSKLSVEFARSASQCKSGNRSQVTKTNEAAQQENYSGSRKRKRQCEGKEDAFESTKTIEYGSADQAWLEAHTSNTSDNKKFSQVISRDNLPSIDHRYSKMKSNDDRDVDLTQATQRDQVRSTASQGPYNRLFLRNLSYTLTEEDIREGFVPFGEIGEIHVPVNMSGIGKGFAFVEYHTEEDAEKAHRAMDDTIFHGRLLQVLISEPKRLNYNEFEISKLPLKQQMSIRRKAESSSRYFSWNSLFMNPDAVITYISNRLGVSKADVLDPSSSDAAIVQARAESLVIEETKKYFLDCGVDLDAFRNTVRGDTGILVKNLSCGTSTDEVLNLFADYGEIERFMMAPSGLTAIVAFQQTAAAKAAFRALSYRKFRESILFLEWAPKNVFTTTSVARIEKKSHSAKLTTNVDDDNSAFEAKGSTLYVRNLNFSTTSKQLTDLCRGLSGFLSATIRTKSDPKNNSKPLSMGYGFLEFRTQAQAKSAMDAMQGYDLGGHKLIIRVSDKAKDTFSVNSTHLKNLVNQRKTKIIVKNLPFEVSKDEIRSLFASYGQLRSLRIPKKIDRTSRGFAFVEFATTRDAENAMEALKHTHILGRRLILQFAAQDAQDPEKEIEKMQNKVNAQINKITLQSMASSRRRKVDFKAVDGE